MKAFDPVVRVRSKRRHLAVLGAAFCAAVAVGGGACAVESGGEPPEREPRAEARVAAESGRLFVLQLRDGRLEVLRSEVLATPPRARRGARAAARGRFEVLDGRGEVLEEGAFHLPHRIHALFAAVDGPAGAASVPDDQPVFWVRTATPPGAATLRLFHRDAARGVTPIGELSL